MTVNKAILIKTIGWSSVALGLYLITLGSNLEGFKMPIKSDDDIIDADFTIIEE